MRAGTDPQSGGGHRLWTKGRAGTGAERDGNRRPVEICDRREESAVDGVRVAEGTDDLIMAAQEQAEQGQDAAQGQAEDDEQNQNQDPNVDERDAENLAHLVQFMKNLVRPGPVRAEGQATAPAGGLGHHHAVRDGG